MALFRIDGMTSPAAIERLRQAVARRNAAIRLAIDGERGLVAGEGADPVTVEEVLQAAAPETGLVFRGPIAPHHDTP